MSRTMCGANCEVCPSKKGCKGCNETDGSPFGKECDIAKYIKLGGIEKYEELKAQIIEEINSFQIPGMAKVDKLYPLVGGFVNLEYRLPNGEKIKFLDDNTVYLGNQIECIFDESGEHCFGVIAGLDFLIVCEYDKDCQNPELLVYKRR